MGELKKIGRYQITRELGRGAMGVVYHAIDPTIGRPVAIKTLRLRDMDDGEQRRRLRERLFREARSAGALSHPGIVTIYDMDEVDGLAYIAMEFVDGETLEDILSRPQGIPRERLLEILRQAAAALDYAHRKGIIHRDIKPANVMIDSAGAVKITDFGIAKITQLEGQTLTGALIGTPNYMSPEQVQGNDIDGRSDQFSLSVIAYEMLSGERPFYGEQISTVVYKIVADQPVPIHNINSTLNDSVDKALRRGLAKKPEKRYATCSAFVTALDGALDNTKSWRVLPRKAHQNLPTASTSALTRTFRPKAKRAIAPDVTEDAKPARRRSWVVPFFAAFVILFSVLAVIAWQTGLLEPTSIGVALSSESPSPQPTAETQPNTSASLQPTPLSSPPSPNAEEERQSPMPVAHGDTPATVSAKAASPAVNDATPATFQQIQIMTAPAAAIATLDGSSEAVCQTPCKLQARTGVHTLTITKDGYQAESREVRVAHDDVEMDLISLRSENGLLWLTSDPAGAHVWVDGKPTDFLTPIQISLSAGPHRVSIQKGGLQSAEQVQIQKGASSTLKLIVKSQ